MKNKLLKISVKEIKTSFKRFMSLFVMSMLGVGTFVGISATAPDMLKSLDTYYDKTNTYDMKLVSTLGFSDNTIEKINNDDIKDIIGSHSKDLIATTNKDEVVIKFIGINNNINKIEVKKGDFPKNNNEILVEETLFKKRKLKLGDYIYLNETNTFNTNKLKVVGTVKSPLYIGALNPSTNRGNTTIGTGNVDYYAYINDDSFNMDYYTEVYLTVNHAKEEVTSSKNYLDLIKRVNINIKNKENRIKKIRYNELYNQKKKEETTNLNKLNAAKKELDNAKIKLDNGKIELDTNRVKLDNANTELLTSKNKLDDGNKQLEEAKQKLQSGKEELDQGKIELDNAINTVNEKLLPYNLTYDDIKELKNSIPTKEEVISIIPENIEYHDEIIDAIEYLYSLEFKERINYITNPDRIDEIIESIDPNYEYYDEIVNDLNSFKDFSTKIINSIKDINTLIEKEEEYNEGLKVYNESLDLYNTKKQEYEDGLNTYNKYLKEYKNGKSKYKEGLNTYYSNLNLYNTSLEEYYKSRKLFDDKISDAYNELGKEKDVELYRYTREDDKDYSGYIEDGNSIDNLSKVFPTIFFIVSILISLISMSRMVEDDRIEIGTLKSLGFSNRHIILKYILYSLSATLLGGIVGAILGFYLLPYYIFSLYKLLFVIENFNIDYNLTNVILGLIISEICICGTTLLTVNKVVKEKPSDLMRPKAPANGKRVLLEKIPFIWNRLNFSNKITVRNLLRYKRRVLMTVAGIIGCTALMLSGFGIRDSIVDIPATQYGKVLNFSDMIYLTENNNEIDINNLFNNKNIKNYTKTKMSIGTVSKYNVNLFVPEDNKSLENILNLKDLTTRKKLTLTDNEIFISDKLAELTHTNIGDYVKFKDSTGKAYKLKVSKVFENYAGNYIIMSKSMYEKKIDTYNTNIVYINLTNPQKEKKVLQKLMNDNKVMSIISAKTTLKNVDDMLKTLNSVVFILILLSGALSFVVLYNLSIINISERKREIATLKVLGFTDKEVDNYVNKETIIITVIGIIIGLLFGIVLTNWIVTTVEVDMVRFIHKIKISSFITTAVMISLFTLIVNLLTHFILKKIDMIESLKTVE